MKSLKYLKANSAFLSSSVGLLSPAVLGPRMGWCMGALGSWDSWGGWRGWYWDQGLLSSVPAGGDPVPGQTLLAL